MVSPRPMAKPLKRQLYEWIKDVYPAWISSGDIERRGLELQFSAYNARRRVQELANEGMLTQKTPEGYAIYQWNPDHPKSPGELKDEQTRELLKANGIL